VVTSLPLMDTASPSLCSTTVSDSFDLDSSPIWWCAYPSTMYPDPYSVIVWWWPNQIKMSWLYIYISFTLYVYGSFVLL
jgi:hypothetical protein